MRRTGSRTYLYLLLLTALVLASMKPAVAQQSWSFGVMDDTQWDVADDGQNPNSVSVGIIKQIDPQFITAGVKFVIQVGDLTDNGTNAALDTRNAAAQDLYNAGIGFFPLRGNHEPSQTAALHFQQIFQQTQGLGPYVFGAYNFSSPAQNLLGLSYAFKYNGANFVLLDQFTHTDGTGSSSNEVNNTNIANQLPWVIQKLTGLTANVHSFVFGHKDLIGEDHVDVLLGADPSQNPSVRNTFIDTLQKLGVRYYISGHDHMYQRSLIESPDSTGYLHQLIGASDSSKFYLPAVPANDTTYDHPTRETSIIQETVVIGYYIYTISGSRVTVDYYASDVSASCGGGECVIYTTPVLNFTKRDSFGYSLTGKEFMVAEGGSYTVVQDSFGGMHAQILGGTNQSTKKDGSNRALTKAVDTGWSPSACIESGTIMSLWGMADLASPTTDTYALSLTYNHLGKLDGTYGLATKDTSGKWVNAVDKNVGGTKQFVLGPWSSDYGLGAYGIDTDSGTAWAVINYNANFTDITFGSSCSD